MAPIRAVIAPPTSPPHARADGALFTAHSRPDWSLRLAMLVAALLGLTAVALSYRADMVLMYNDAAAHLTIARRLLDSRTPGVAQLGTVWLPLPHLLLQPFVYNDALWRTGLAGSLLGFFCYMGTALFLFRGGRLLGRSELAAWVAMLTFALNPNILYLQSTAMTESVYLLMMTGSGYFLLRWGDGEALADLMLAGLLAVLAVGTRYDGWVFAALSTALVGIGVHRRWRTPVRTQALTIAYVALPGYAALLWLFYNWLVFGSPLAFASSQAGEISVEGQVLRQSSGLLTPLHGNLWLSLSSYNASIFDVLGGGTALLALLGLAVYALTTRRQPSGLIPFVFLSSYPFQVLSLILGLSIITTPRTAAGYDNVRYALMLAPGAAIFIAYLAGYLGRRFPPRLATAAALLFLAVQGAAWVPNWPRSIPVIAEGQNAVPFRVASIPAARYFREHYRGGGVLIDDGNVPFLIQAQISLANYVTANNGNLWFDALRDPASYVVWAVIRQGQGGQGGDSLSVLFAPSSPLFRRYSPAYAANGYVIYRRAR